MTSEPVVARRSAGIARLTLNRPDKRNALNDALVDALRSALESAAGDGEVRVVAIDGAGPDFCAGADLEGLRRIADAGVLENLGDADRLADLFLTMRQLPKPIVALVRGRALAGGCGLATACDLVLAARGATFGYPEVRIGFVPAMVMAFLGRSVSEKRAFEMVALGETYTADDAERFGLVNRVFPDESFEPECDAFLAAVAGRSSSALMLAKALFSLQDGMELGAAIRAGAAVNALARTTDDTRAGIERFLSRRPRRGE